jgi:hypothetical protein
MIRRSHLSFATVVSLLALFVALGGTAVAARQYLLTSTKQISPKVLKALRGRTGPRGRQGPPGPVTTTLPRGDTLRGEFKIDTSAPSPGWFAGSVISFGGYRLRSAPTPEAIGVGGSPTKDCPGTAANPAAARGKLCFYVTFSTNVSTADPYTLGPGMTSEDAPTSTDGKSDRFGTQLYALYTASGRMEIDGTWAVTAP